MGNTIQYYGEVIDPERVAEIIVAAEAFFAEKGWATTIVDGEEFTIWMECGRDGLTFFKSVGIGIIARPHAMCEPFPIVFRFDGKLGGCVKTQFAPIEVHKDIVALLRKIEPLIGAFDVSDETGYWETGSEDDLRCAMEDVADRMMEKVATGNFEGPIVEPSGRILDLQVKPAGRVRELHAGKPQGWIGSVFTRLRKTA